MDEMGNVGEWLQRDLGAVEGAAARGTARLSCLVQPFLRSASDLFAFLVQPGSLNTPWIVAASELIRLSYPGSGHRRERAPQAW